MVAAAFVAPYLLEATTRFVHSAAQLPGVRLGVVTQEPAENLPPELRACPAGHWRVDDALDPVSIAEGVRDSASQGGESVWSSISDYRPPPSSMIAYSYDIDFHAAWAALMLLDRFEPPERRYGSGTASLRGQGHGRVRAVHGLDEVQREIGHLVVEARLPQPGQPAAAGYEGEGFVIVRHPDTEVVEDALARIVSTVRVELAESGATA